MVCYRSNEGAATSRCSYAAWYADVAGESLRLQYGVRCMLVYTLVVEPQCELPLSAASLPVGNITVLRNALDRWNQSQSTADSMHCLYHILESHQPRQYDTPGQDPDPLSIKDFRGQDAAHVRVLSNMANHEDAHFDVFFACLEREEIGICEYDEALEYHNKLVKKRMKALDRERSPGSITSYHGYSVEHGLRHKDGTYTKPKLFHRLTAVEDTRYNLVDLRDLEGNMLLHQAPSELEAANVLQMGGFDRARKREAEYWDCGPTARHLSRVTALVLIPRTSFPAFIVRHQNLGPRPYLEMTSQGLRHGTPSSESDRDDPGEAAWAAMAYYSRSIINGRTWPFLARSFAKVCSRIFSQSEGEDWHAEFDKTWGPIDKSDLCSTIPFEDILKALVLIDRFDLFELVIKDYADPERGETVDGVFLQWLRGWVDEPQCPIARSERFKKIREGLTHMLVTMYNFDLDDRLEAIAGFAPVYQHSGGTCEDGLGSWLADMINGCLESMVDVATNRDFPVGERETVVLIQLAKYIPHTNGQLLSFFTNSVMRILPPSNDTSALYLAFLRYLDSHSDDLTFPCPAEAIRELYFTIAGPLVHSIDFTTLMAHSEEDEAMLEDSGFLDKGVNTIDLEDLVKLHIALAIRHREEVADHAAPKLGEFRDVGVYVTGADGQKIRDEQPPEKRAEMRWAAIQASLKPGESLVPETLWAKFVKKLLEAAPRLRLDQFERLWIPFVDAISPGAFQLNTNIKEDQFLPFFDILDKVLEMRRYHFEIVSTLLKSYFTRMVGVGCDDESMRQEAMDIFSYGIHDSKNMEKLLGKELFEAMLLGNMPVLYDESLAGDGPRPQMVNEECNDPVEVHAKRKRGDSTRYSSSWEVKGKRRR
ncbi:hypothetical protein QBC41DRAFT_306531 [Cercophora samala]|uniref:Uncharacterized protein n=1 Tax=Cercophora samala TaxID=330535 RepID=A0AA39Z5J5_9PEZI|nr:hypothetical protein QBC41DRAFT_306531 [Cercophora samala]